MSTSRSFRWVGGPILRGNCALICITLRPILKGFFCYRSLWIPQGGTLNNTIVNFQARRPSELLSDVRVSPRPCADSTHYALSVQSVRSRSEDVREERSPFYTQRWPLVIFITIVSVMSWRCKVTVGRIQSVKILKWCVSVSVWLNLSAAKA